MNIVEIPVGDIQEHPRNPREDLGDIDSLTASIRANGVRQNLTVIPRREVEDATGPQPWVVVIGHRRLAAARDAGLATVPCATAHMDRITQVETMILENTQRSDITPIEEARAYQGLLDLGGDVASIAERTGRSMDYVRSRLRIAAIPDDTVRRHRAVTQLTIGQLECLAEFDGDPDAQERLAATAGTANWAFALARERRLRESHAWTIKAREWIEDHHIPMLDDSLLPSSPWKDPEGWETTWQARFDLGTPFDRQWMGWAGRRAPGILRLAIRSDGAVTAYRPRPDKGEDRKARERREAARMRRERRGRLERPVRELHALARRSRIAWIHANRNQLPHRRILAAIALLVTDLVLGPTPQRFNRMAGGGYDTDRAIRAHHLAIAGLDTPDDGDDPTGPKAWHLIDQDMDRDRIVGALTLLCALMESRIAWDDWTDGTRLTDHIAPYYEALDRLGYQPADEERAAADGHLIGALDKDEETEGEQS